MGFLEYLTVALFATWATSEIGLCLIGLRNRSRGSSGGRDRFSFVGMWLCIMFPVLFALAMWSRRTYPDGPGDFHALTPALGYLGCLVIIFGITTRLVAVATLKRHFTITVSIVEKHEIVDTGIYGALRHPSYLGVLASLLGFGLASGNWFSLAALVVLPFAATLYRIRVEESALLRHFGPAYQEYASRTKRLLPGIY